MEAHSFLYQDLPVWVLLREDNPAGRSVALHLKHRVSELLQLYDRNKPALLVGTDLHYQYVVRGQIKKTLSKNVRLLEFHVFYMEGIDNMYKQ